MKELGKKRIFLGAVLVSAFVIFTWLVQNIDVKPLGVNETNIGFSTFNCTLHKLIGVNMTLYTITDWLGLVPLFVVAVFGVLGLVQLIVRKSLLKVDDDILILGLYYIVIAVLYIVFETIPINYRPILINGFLETSYPSSTTLLVLGVMPTLAEQINSRCKNNPLRITANLLITVFSIFMVVGRLVSGVHWFTDILGSVIISAGLFNIYKGLIFIICKRGLNLGIRSKTSKFKKK